MRLPALLAAVALAFWAAPASADVVNVQSTYAFAGTCADCTGVAGAELVLQNYTPGQAIDGSNFVSFHYDGTNLLGGFTIAADQASSLSGSMTAPFPSAQDFFILGNSEVFSSSNTGLWCAGDACFSDYGFTNAWSLVATTTPTNVPEPLSLTLLGAPLLGFAALRRR